MGSNANRHFDKGSTREWGSKGRKEAHHQKRAQLDEAAIEDSAIDGAPVTSKKRRKKDTKRFCRGKEGREHQWVHLKDHNSWWHPWSEWRCEGCQKTQYRRPQ